MTKTCVLHIGGNQYPPFPEEHHTRRIWKEMASGFDEYHIVARGENMRFAHCVDGRIHLHLMPSFGRRMWVFFFLSWLLPYYVIRYRPTHLLAQCPVMGGLAAAACARVLALPLFVELHGRYYFRPTTRNGGSSLEFAIYRTLSNLTFAAADKIRCLSLEMKEALIADYGVTIGKKAVVIPPRVDLDVFCKVKTDYSFGPELRVITVGTFSVNKNHEQLISHLAVCGVPFHLTLVGAGPLENSYIELARSLGVAECLTIMGSVTHDELARVLPSHDIYIHYSLGEGLPRSILEAMAAGLPVVTTRAGYASGVFIDNVNALLLEAPLSSCLIDAVGRLTSSEDLRRRVGKAGRATIEEQFDAKVVFESYRREVASSKPVSSSGRY